jgi:hypothetical protein
MHSGVGRLVARSTFSERLDQGETVDVSLCEHFPNFSVYRLSGVLCDLQPVP